MGDKRIKVHEKEIYDFVREKKNGRTWTEIKKKFINRITEKQINIKLKKMLQEKHTLMKIGKFYMPNYFYTPSPYSYAQKIEDEYNFIGFSRYILEKIPHIIHKALLNYLKFLAEKNHKIFETMDDNPDEFEKIMDSKTWKEKNEFYSDLNEIDDLKYYFKEGFKFIEHRIKKECKN